MPRCSLLLILVAFAFPATAQTVSTDDDWCDQGTYSHDGDGQVVYCEVRTVTFVPSGVLHANASPNGGIQVEGWGRDDVEVRARVQARGRTDAEARALAHRVELRTDGTLRAETPDLGRRQWVAVNFRLRVPHASDLDLTAHNGGIQIENVSGDIQFETQNGGVTLDGLGGDVRGRTTNGGLNISLSGRTWDGKGLDVSTTNGGIDLDIPRNYSADLEASTTNGTISHSIAPRSRRQRHLQTMLGDGGATIRVLTTNGGVSIGRD